MNTLNKLWKKGLTALGLTFGMVASSHAVIDVSAAVTQVTTDGVAAITAIGGAMLILSGVAIAFKWAKAAFFG